MQVHVTYLHTDVQGKKWVRMYIFGVLLTKSIWCDVSTEADKGKDANVLKDKLISEARILAQDIQADLSLNVLCLFHICQSSLCLKAL